jgi:hypothetical protein
LVIAAESDDVIPMDMVERIHASAKNAKGRLLHVVPGSRHLSLFPREQDFLLALNMIIDVCRNGRDNNGLQSDKQPRGRIISETHSPWARGCVPLKPGYRDITNARKASKK